jgi:ubiquinone/menaquinone biosynthesis C-methylase UbiE
MFEHLENPKPLLTEMARVLKPGGQMLWSESDQGTIALDCSQQDTWWTLLRCRNRQFANPFAGRQLLRYAYWLGLEDIKVQMLPVIVTDYDLAGYFIQASELEEQALREGLLTEQALTAWHEDIDRLEQESNGSGFASINVMIVRGHKPE